MSDSAIKLEPSWKARIGDYLRRPDMQALSAHRGFIGCGHFSAANRYLESRGQPPIDWSLPSPPLLRTISDRA